MIRFCRRHVQDLKMLKVIFIELYLLYSYGSYKNEDNQTRTPWLPVHNKIYIYIEIVDWQQWQRYAIYYYPRYLSITYNLYCLHFNTFIYSRYNIETFFRFLVYLIIFYSERNMYIIYRIITMSSQKQIKILYNIRSVYAMLQSIMFCRLVHSDGVSDYINKLSGTTVLYIGRATWTIS